MKRYGFVLLAIFLIPAGLAFAGGEGQKSSPSGSAQGGIEFWNDKPNPELYIPFSAHLEKASGVPVKIIDYPDVSAYQTAIQQSIRQPDAPGLFTWWSGFPLQTLVENGLLADLTEVWTESLIPAGVNPGIADSLKINGKIYAAPFNVLYNTVIYNKRVFAKAGVTREPATWDEFLAACAKIKAQGITPILLKNDTWASFIWFQQLVAVYDPQLYLDLCNGTEPYTGQRMRAVMALWKDMLDKGYFSAPVQEYIRAFSLDEYAMMLEPTNTPVEQLTKNFGMAAETDYDAFVVPGIGNNKRVVFFEVAPLCVAENSAQKAQALRVLRNYYALEPQQFLTDEAGMVLTSKVTVQNATVRKMFGFANEPGTYQFLLRFYENTPSELRDVVIDEMLRFILGQGSIDQVLTTIQQKADSVFK
ncbi:MAG: ABC transporter substrate-binding protein [Treponema sp.]|nr:ABC transporter substrate-binding protein [Treponema sp.]